MSLSPDRNDLSTTSTPNRAWAIVALAALGVAASVAIAVVLQDRERGLLEIQLEQRAHDRIAVIERELLASVTQVDSIARLFEASDVVTRNEFTVFVEPILRNEPTFMALGYDTLVRREDRSAHEESVRRSGYPDYRVTQKAADGSLVPVTDRPEYVAVTFLEPLAGNEAALGYDIRSEPARRAALDLARDSGQAAITEAIVLVQQSVDRPGLLICVPVYSGTTPVTVSERRQRLQGFAVGVIRIADLVTHALAGLRPAGMHVRISEASAAAGHRVVYVHRSRTLSPNQAWSQEASFGSAYARTSGIDIAGRHWIVETAPTAAFVAEHTTWTPVAFLLAGLLTTMTVTQYVVRQAAANARLRAAVLAREHAEERRASLGRVLDESHEEFYVFDPETLRFLHINRGACNNLGYTMDDLRALTVLDVKPRMTPDSFAALLKPLRDGARQSIEFTTVHRRADGSLYDVEAHVQMTSFDGAPACVAVILDITERKRLEERQRQSQRLEALGTLAGGTAHDVNNLLTAIMGYSELTLDALPRDGEARKYMGEVVKATERARDVVRQILTFSRGKPIERRTIDLRDVVGEALGLMQASLPATIAIQANLADRCFVRGDSSQIHQVLVNLCTNADHAMRGSDGTLAVSVEAVDLSAAEAAQLGDMNSGAYTRIDVSDSGTGIAPEIVERIFDPFFTTKEPGEGTGMGLAVAHGIVKGHGGTMRVASELDRGTTVSVYLPRAESSRADDSAGRTTGAVRGERIMVIDDEPSIARLMVETLSGLGYVVEKYESGSAALDAIREQNGALDLVITDYSMPGMTGTTLAREIRQSFPDLPVILMSGFGVLIDQGEVHGSGVRELLTKPLRRDELDRAIRRTLDRTTAREPGVP